MRTNRLLGAFLLLCIAGLSLSARSWTFASEDSRLSLIVDTQPNLGLTLQFSGQEILRLNDLDVFSNRENPGSPQWQRVSNRLRTERIQALVSTRNAAVASRFREIVLDSDGSLSLTLRLYDRALAYRFTLKSQGEVDVRHEQVAFVPKGGTTVYFPEEKSFQSHYEGHYQVLPIEEIKEGQMAHLPLLMKSESGVLMRFNEADVVDYPCMFLQRNQKGLGSLFPGVVLESGPSEKRPDRNETVRSDGNVIARVTGPRHLPWRVITVTDDDRELLARDLVYELSIPPDPVDWSWIRPGQVAWDWWNANNLFAVPFKAGLNTETYKAYIDFAAENGIEYVILDEGWSKTTREVLAFNPRMNVGELIAYGREKNVGLILWLLWKPLDEDMEGILDSYASWGVKGIKVDFMQRADQYMVNFYARVAREAAQRKLLVDFHGAFKPTGLHRAFPNVLSYEGVRGLEHSKWSDQIDPEHDLILPFIRMSAGPMDYTPGAMDNAGKGDFFPRFNRPMSQGTRAHQLAMYGIYESPLQMLCDSPSRYRREEESVRFIARIPTTWDETRVLEARVGDYLLLARRKGDLWYLAAMTDWTERVFMTDLSFLPGGDFRLEYVEDGPNADRMATDHRFLESRVNRSSSLTLKLASGGGWLGIITPIK